MSARLKLKHMKYHIAMVEDDNAHLRYELARLSREWELIGAREQLYKHAKRRIRVYKMYT